MCVKCNTVLEVSHCVAMCALPVCSVICAVLGQLMAMLLKNIVSIAYKQGISVDPLMWPIPQVLWRELLVASPLFCFTKNSVTF